MPASRPYAVAVYRSAESADRLHQARLTIHGRQCYAIFLDSGVHFLCAVGYFIWFLHTYAVPAFIVDEDVLKHQPPVTPDGLRIVTDYVSIEDEQILVDFLESDFQCRYLPTYLPTLVRVIFLTLTSREISLSINQYLPTYLNYIISQRQLHCI